MNSIPKKCFLRTLVPNAESVDNTANLYFNHPSAPYVA